MNIIFCIFKALMVVFIVFSGLTLPAQTNPTNDVTTPLHLLKAVYPTPYGTPAIDDITKILIRVYGFLDAATPCKIVNSSKNEEVVEIKNINNETVIAPGSFRLTSYEWGVTYAGMLLAGEITGDKRFTEYTNKRLNLIADLTRYYRSQQIIDVGFSSSVHTVMNPQALDDAGAMCAAMIKSIRSGFKTDLRPMIDNYINFISTKQFRLPDGTLARNRPQPNTLWLDDLFMSVPALAQMGKLTGNTKYFDDAVKQVRQFSQRMFNKERGIYMHGWVEMMEVHPEYHWARANGWAVMALVELLDVLPKNHLGYNFVLEQLRSHIKGLATYQDGTGFWHQLIDLNDTYLETSATAIYAFSIARAINKGYIDKFAYSPVAILAWNAVATKVNDKGQVEGTCVGTGMAFDPAFYYYRPINVFAAHGYGPVLLAGAEVIRLIESNTFEINDSSLQLKENSGMK